MAGGASVEHDLAVDGRHLGTQPLKADDPSVAVAVYVPASIAMQIRKVADGNMSAWLRKAIVQELARDGR